MRLNRQLRDFIGEQVQKEALERNSIPFIEFPQIARHDQESPRYVHIC